MELSDKKLINEWKTRLTREIFKKIEQRVKSLRQSKMVTSSTVLSLNKVAK